MLYAFLSKPLYMQIFLDNVECVRNQIRESCKCISENKVIANNSELKVVASVSDEAKVVPWKILK